MLRVVAVAALLLVVVPVEAQQGRVATDYIRVNVEPDFQYRSDQDVRLPLQVRAVRGGVPQPDKVSVEVRTEDGELLSIPGGQGWLQDGVQPFPHVVWINLGQQEVGLYRVIIHAKAGGLERDWKTEFDVVHPPQGYEAALLGATGKAGRFVFEAHDPRHEFTVTMYRGSPSAGHVLEQVQANKTVLAVPYIPGESVSIRVQDENGWRNAENKNTDWSSGITTYPEWVWNPDYQGIQNYKNRSWQEAAISGAILLGVVGAFYVSRRRSA